MWVWIDRLGVFVFDAGLSAAVLWVGAWLAMLGCRQPARRLRIARAAAIGSLVLGPLVGFRIVPRVDLVDALVRPGALPHPLLSPRWPSRARAGGEANAPTPAASRAAEPWPARILTLTYVAGVAGGLGWLTLGWAALGRLNRRSADPSAGAQTLYDALRVARPACGPRLRVSGRVGRPVLAGFLRPVILIPPGLDLPGNRKRLRLSLLHELAHAEGADPGFALVGGLARAFWFFLPPVWWAGAQGRLDQEFLADRRAALGFGPAGDYASSLLELASDRAGSPGPPVHAGAAAEGFEGSALVQRVLMLLRCPFPVEPRPPAWWSWALSVVFALATLAASSLSVRPPDPVPAVPGPPDSFEVLRLDIPAPAPGPTGRSLRFELPVRLPERFEITADVLGDRDTLRQTRIAGLPLAGSARLGAGWHSIHIRRGRNGVALDVDGTRVSEAAGLPASSNWLSIEPAPGRPAALRRLVLTW